MSKKYKKNKRHKSLKIAEIQTQKPVKGFEVRSVESFSQDISYTTPGNWITVEAATEEALKKNPWSYKAITFISSLVSSVPWSVYDKETKEKIEHPLSRLLEYPNPKTSRQTMIETMSKWLLLVGNSYLYKTFVKNQTNQLWLVNPDMLTPVPGKNLVTEPIIGYKTEDQSDSDPPKFGYDEIIRHYFVDPSDPTTAIAPTQALSYAIDTDTAAEVFNYNTMKNRGVIDGVFTFEREFASLDDTKDIADNIEEKYGKKRGFIVLGSKAKYQKTALTPAEMDFIESRKWYRDEIMVVHGVSLALISNDSMTYNNYNAAMRITWEQSIIPMLNDMADTFNLSFRNELADTNLVIGYDLSGVKELQSDIEKETGSAKNLYEMGVPVDQINEKFGFGLEPYEGWDKSSTLVEPQNDVKPDEKIDTKKDKVDTKDQDQEDRGFCPVHEMRQTAFSRNMNQQIDQDTDVVAPEMIDIYDKWESDVLDAMVKKDKAQVRKIGKKYKKIIEPIYKDNFFKYGLEYGVDEYNLIESKRSRKSFETRETDKEKEEKILGYLEPMYKQFEDVDFIETVREERVFELIAKSVVEEWSLKETTNALIDTGLFSPEQALRNSRTWIGTAASSGRHSGAKAVDADAKEWMSSGDRNTRQTHKNANGQVQPIDTDFTVGGEKGKYPLDYRFSAKERLNCRCVSTYY